MLVLNHCHCHSQYRNNRISCYRFKKCIAQWIETISHDPSISNKSCTYDIELAAPSGDVTATATDRQTDGTSVRQRSPLSLCGVRVEPCADVSISAAARRVILTGGGGAPIDFFRRRRRQ